VYVGLVHRLGNLPNVIQEMLEYVLYRELLETVYTRTPHKSVKNKAILYLWRLWLNCSNKTTWKILVSGNVNHDSQTFFHTDKFGQLVRRPSNKKQISSSTRIRDSVGKGEELWLQSQEGQKLSPDTGPRHLILKMTGEYQTVDHTNKIDLIVIFVWFRTAFTNGKTQTFRTVFKRPLLVYRPPTRHVHLSSYKLGQINHTTVSHVRVHIWTFVCTHETHDNPPTQQQFYIFFRAHFIGFIIINNPSFGSRRIIKTTQILDSLYDVYSRVLGPSDLTWVLRVNLTQERGNHLVVLCILMILSNLSPIYFYRHHWHSQHWWNTWKLVWFLLTHSVSCIQNN
jgi:hypothetical protein